MINVSIMDQRRVIFDGIANSVVLPGNEGEFEILDFHKPIISFLRKGDIVIDEIGFPISKGVARFSGDELVALVEL
jgi:F0F1-type ATP synthase epsilon subunit